MSAIVSSSARWVFSSSFFSCTRWKRELYHSFSSLLLEIGLLLKREIREQREEEKREKKGSFSPFFSPFWMIVYWFFFSRAFLLCARLKVKSDEDEEEEEEEEEGARRALDDHAVIFLWKENVSKIIFARERRRGILLFHRRRFKIHQKKRVLCDLFFGLAWLGGSFFSVSFFL